MLAVVSGYFTVFPGSTLTLPGIAGIILGIGMGVDANVITAERIKEELSKNKTLEGAVKSGFKMGLTPIVDGNVTIVIVAAIPASFPSSSPVCACGKGRSAAGCLP